MSRPYLCRVCSKPGRPDPSRLSATAQTKAPALIWRSLRVNATDRPMKSILVQNTLECRDKLVVAHVHRGLRGPPCWRVWLAGPDATSETPWFHAACVTRRYRFVLKIIPMPLGHLANGYAYPRACEKDLGEGAADHSALSIRNDPARPASRQTPARRFHHPASTRRAPASGADDNRTIAAA